MIDERARHQLYLSLERHLGASEADTMMDLLPPVGWADVATKHDLDLKFDVLDSRIGSLEAQMNLRFDAMEDRFATKQDLSDAIQGLTRLMVTLMVGMMLTLTAVLLSGLALVR